MKKYWLMKSEPDVFSIQDLARDKITPWEGVRNYQARNFMTQQMTVGDEVLFYHSNATPPGVAGLAKVCTAAHPDQSALNPKSEYYEPKATSEKPIWECVNVAYVGVLPKFVSLADLKANKKLKGLLVLQKGSRLSITPVAKEHFLEIKKMGGL